MHATDSTREMLGQVDLHQMHIRCCTLKKEIEDGKLGVLLPETLGGGGPDLHYFLLGDGTFTLLALVVEGWGGGGGGGGGADVQIQGPTR